MSTGSRYLKQFQYTLEQDSVSLTGSFAVDADGYVASYQGGGIESVADFDGGVTDGYYVIQLDNGWNHFYSFNAHPVCAANSSVASVQLKMDPTTIQTDIKNNVPLNIQCLDYAGAAVNPAATCQIFFEIKVRKSSVGPFDSSTTV